MHSGRSAATPGQRAFKRRLDKAFASYLVGTLLFVLLMALLEQLGLPRRAIGVGFLLATVAVYACIGMASRTADAAEYYVAGRRVPAMYNGMATSADWMSAASFIGLAGTLYLTGYSGLAFILGWTGGYCVVALFLAPYLRKFGQFTVPDFLGERYGGRLTRGIGVFGAILCSFTYVMAQIYGVGLIIARLSGLPFEIGVFAALGSILLCSFLGGMRAVTWTQVAQYVVLIVAYLVPVAWLSMQQTGVPVPQLVYGQQLQKVTELERQLMADPRENEVVAAFRARAEALGHKLHDVTSALATEHAVAERALEQASVDDGTLLELQRARRALAALPRDAPEATQLWSTEMAMNEARAQPLAGMPPHAQAFAGDPHGDAAAREHYDNSRRNFLALVF
jgi:cation/acetate symporter